MNELQQNIHSSVHGVLQLIASRQEQIAYQQKAPFVSVSNELFNQWDDWYHPEDEQFHNAFSARELEALTRFHTVLETVADATPQTVPRLDEFMRTREWKQLADAAQIALEAFEVK